MRARLQLPIHHFIPEGEKTPLVVQLSALIEKLASFLGQQAEQIQLLKDEIAGLKGHKPKPKIRPSALEKSKDGTSVCRKKRFQRQTYLTQKSWFF